MNLRKGQMRYRGVVMAEFAIVLVVLLMVTLGALQYGWAFYCLQRATNAARHAARVQAVADAPASTVTEAQAEAMVADIDGDCTITGPTAGMVTAKVVIPQAKAQLIPWNVMPVPELRPTVTMHKEGTATP